MSKTEVIEWLEKYVECALAKDNKDCFRGLCFECSHYFDASKKIEVLTTTIALLKEDKK